MYYVEQITTPAQTAQEDAIVTYMGMTWGYIQKVRICFPPGCVGLMHVQIYRYEQQIYPSTPGQSFAWDGFVVEFVDSYPLFTEPYELKIVTWNDDDSYEHTIQVHVELSEFSLVEALQRLLREGYMIGGY